MSVVGIRSTYWNVYKNDTIRSEKVYRPVDRCVYGQSMQYLLELLQKVYYHDIKYIRDC